MTTWYVYILQCVDGSLYTGVTTDVARRVDEHNGRQGVGARYTRPRRPVRLLYQEVAPDRGAAMRRESAIKRLTRGRKLALIRAGGSGID